MGISLCTLSGGGETLHFKIENVKKRITKPSMAILILFLVFTLSVNSTLSRTLKNVKKIFK